MAVFMRFIRPYSVHSISPFSHLFTPDPAKRIEFRNIRCLGGTPPNGKGSFTFKPKDKRRDEYADRYEDYWGKRHFEVGTIGITISGRKNMCDGSGDVGVRIHYRQTDRQTDRQTEQRQTDINGEKQTYRVSQRDKFYPS